MDDIGYTLYKHTTPAGKVYFGITGRSTEERWNNGNGYRGNKHFWSAIKKYGWSAIEHEVLLSGLSKSEAEELERELIEQAGSTDPRIGYNLDCGGSSVGKASNATRKKMAEASRQLWKDPAYREKVVASLRKRTFSTEQRAAISRSRKGKKTFSGNSEEDKRHDEREKRRRGKSRGKVGCAR